jgi:hypothetical protein
MIYIGCRITNSLDDKYMGSGLMLQNAMKKHGKENFKRTILKLCTCKWQLKYEELKYQMDNRAIFRTDCYNSILNVRIGKVPKALKDSY